jgi:D-3-phosphoglycerate dehydrogenase
MPVADVPLSALLVWLPSDRGDRIARGAKVAYQVVVTRGYAEPDGSTVFGDAGLTSRVLEDEVAELRADHLRDADAVLVLGSDRVTAASVPESRRLRHVARFGVDG